MTNVSFPSATTASPRTQINARITSAVAAGTIKSTDQGALSDALDTIDDTLAGERGTKSTGGSIKTKIDSLIDEQTKSGALTDDQASELKSVFAKGAKDHGPPPGGGPGGPGGAGRSHGPGGAPPPPPADSTDGDDSDSSATSTAAATTTTTTSDSTLDAMSKFLETLRQQAADATAYASSGTAASTASTGLVLDDLV